MPTTTKPVVTTPSTTTPVPSAPPESSGSKTNLILGIIISVLGVLALGAGAIVMMSGDDAKPKKSKFFGQMVDFSQ